MKERIQTLEDCQRALEQNQIRLGWNFPHIDATNVVYMLDYVEFSTTLMHINEIGRFYQSGQFAFYRAFPEDWIEDNELLSTDFKQRLKPGLGLDILATLYGVSETYEFAARLAKRELLDDQFLLKINLVSTVGRQLFFMPGVRKHLFEIYRCQAPALPRELSFEVKDFVARSRELSLQHFSWIMEHFKFYSAETVFKRDQELFFEGRSL